MVEKNCFAIFTILHYSRYVIGAPRSQFMTHSDK